jgi:hypothetical protein
MVDADDQKIASPLQSLIALIAHGAEWAMLSAAVVRGGMQTH